MESVRVIAVTLKCVFARRADVIWVPTLPLAPTTAIFLRVVSNTILPSVKRNRALP